MVYIFILLFIGRTLMNKFYTVEEYAKLKNVTDKTVYEWVKENKLNEINLSHKISKLVYEPTDSTKKNIAIIAFSNLKGGCGKTTLATHFAALLSIIGFKVLLIDTDHQNQCSMFFPQQPYELTIVDVLKGKINIQDCIYKTSTKTSEIDIIYSDFALSLFVPMLNDRDRLKKSIDPIIDNYDFIIIDTSPNFDIVSQNVARISTHIIIPIKLETLHIQGMEHNLLGLEQVAQIDTNKVIGIMPNIVELQLAQQRAIFNLLSEKYPNLLFMHEGLLIPKDPELPKVVDFNTTIFDFRPKSRGSSAIKRALHETLRRI